MRVDPVCDVDFRSAPLSVILRHFSDVFNALDTRAPPSSEKLCSDQCASASDFERSSEAVRVDLSQFSFIAHASHVAHVVLQLTARHPNAPLTRSKASGLPFP